jgi:hypothetical protein
MTETSQSDRPDLTNGIPEADLADSAMLVGLVGEEQVLLARRGAEMFAISATFTHYGGPSSRCNGESRRSTTLSAAGLFRGPVNWHPERLP